MAHQPTVYRGPDSQEAFLADKLRFWDGVGKSIIGTIIFKSGEKLAGVTQKSWLSFSLDSVIPVINLDKDHEGVRFAGWRQYFLYFLRFLGAVLVVLVLDFLKQAITGPK